MSDPVARHTKRRHDVRIQTGSRGIGIIGWVLALGAVRAATNRRAWVSLVVAFLVLGVTGAVLGVVFVVFGPAKTAGAEIYTCGSKSNYFDGAYTATTTTRGTSAYIVNHFGAVCDTDTSSGNFSTAWAMISGASSSQYAQTGFERWYNSPDYFFAQDNDGLVVDTTYGASPSYGEDHHYWENYNSTCTCVQELIDSDQFQETPFHPLTVWSEPFSNQFLGEVAYKENDIPGNPSDAYTAYTQMQIQLTSGSFTATLPTIYYANDNSSRWTHSTVASNAYNIWTYYEYSP